MADTKGFTLVELVVVMAIVAILAAVATPAYINYVNRTKQGNAESMLMTARLEEESYYTDNGTYASTIECLPSFAGTNSACIGDCSNGACQKTYTDNTSGYSFTVVSASTDSYQVKAWRKINGVDDVVTISASTETPTVQDTNALHFSIFQWLFGH